MKENSLDNSFWNLRYQNNQTGWDLGEISNPIKKWFDNQENKKINILIPGAGKGHEVKYGFENGFGNIFYMDFSSRAADLFKEICPLFPKDQILTGDFFSLKKPLFFDVIIEQTFFCAIHPVLRPNYVEKTNEILKENGKIIGLLFNREFDTNGPPFGGTEKEYRGLFNSKFNFKKFENSLLSSLPRKEYEFWIELIKKN
jgi:thiopurine S-methyltransferase